MNRPLRLARVVTTSFTFATLLYDQIAAVRDAGIQLSLISNDDERLSQIASAQQVRYHCIPMARRPHLYQDVRSLLSLIRLLRVQKFDIIHSTTPKAGLLAAVAGVVSGTPIRLHTYTGQRWVTLGGFQRQYLRAFDRLIGMLCTMTFADSASQRQFLIDENIVRPEIIKVLASGSISGVNLSRFDPGRWNGEIRTDTREALGIPPDALVIVFVGRVTRDKGITELIEAFVRLSTKHSGLFLLLVGPFEPELDPIPQNIRFAIETNPLIQATGFCSDPERYLGSADIFCLPSYREGFGSVVIEAGAMGLPAVATSVVGLRDAIEDGKTGILVPARDSHALAKALELLVTRSDLRMQLGMMARKRAMEEFDARMVNKAVVAEYFRLTSQRMSNVYE